MAKPATRPTRKKPKKLKLGRKLTRAIFRGSKRSKSKRGWFLRLVRGTGKGTAVLIGKAAVGTWGWGARKVAEFKDRQSFGPDYKPEPGEIPNRMTTTRQTSTCAACGKRFGNAEDGLAHFMRAHADEPSLARPRPAATLDISRSVKNKGKVRVRPPQTSAPAGRHRQAAHRTKAEVLVAAYRQKMDEIGRKAVMAENSASNLITRGWRELDEHKPRRLSGIRDAMLGLERTQDTAAEIVMDLRRHFIQLGFDPAECAQLVRAQEGLEQAARGFSAFIAVIESNYAADIRAAQARQAGSKPSDETLAN